MHFPPRERMSSFRASLADCWHENPLRCSLFFVSICGIGAGITACILQFPLNTGDASIYLVFAKCMKKGLFWYGNEGPVHGATSPLWAALLGLGHALTDEPPLVFLKSMNLCIFALGALAVGTLVRFASQDILPGLIAAGLWLCLYTAQEGVALLYASPLAAALATTSVLLTARVSEPYRHSESQTVSSSMVLTLAFVLGLLPLARPECLFVMAPCLIALAHALLFKRKHRGPGTISYPLLVLAVCISIGMAGTYYLWMWGQTGQLVPSSIAARAMRTQENILDMPRLKVLGHFFCFPRPRLRGLCDVLAVGCFAIGVVSLLFTERKATALLAISCCFVFLTALLLVPAGNYTARYTVTVKPIVFLFSAVGISDAANWINARLSRDVRWLRIPLFGLAVVGLALAPGYAAYQIHKAYSVRTTAMPIETILERDTAAVLNNLAQRKERVLVYEIQTQYYLQSQAVSMDGIVGGEIIPYLKTGDLVPFIKKHEIRWVCASNAMEYRPLLARTVLGQLWQQDGSIQIGGELTLRGLVFSKVFQRSSRDVPFTGACKSIYRVAW